jgi:hypothetical protein
VSNNKVTKLNREVEQYKNEFIKLQENHKREQSECLEKLRAIDALFTTNEVISKNKRENKDREIHEEKTRQIQLQHKKTKYDELHNKFLEFTP